ncbi:MAG: CopG family transcriptional regulator [Candidatus Hodarchaeota archaeon]
MKGEKKVVSLPTELYNKITQRIAGTDFDSVDDYVVFVLEEVVKEEEPEMILSEKDEKEVKKRLRALGYID